nr:MAG TPA: hypothetical protein [Caudoviricetes sp.]
MPISLIKGILIKKMSFLIRNYKGAFIVSDNYLKNIQQDRDRLEELLVEYDNLNKKNKVILKECKNSINDLKIIMLLTVIVAMFCIYTVTHIGYKVNNFNMNNDNKMNNNNNDIEVINEICSDKWKE